MLLEFIVQVKRTKFKILKNWKWVMEGFFLLGHLIIITIIGLRHYLFNNKGDNPFDTKDP